VQNETEMKTITNPARTKSVSQQHTKYDCNQKKYLISSI